MPPAFSPSASGGVWQAHPPAAPNTYFPRATSSEVGSAADVGIEPSVRMTAATVITTRGQVFGAQVIVRRRAQVAGVALQVGLRDVAVAEERLIEVEQIGAGLAHGLGLAVGDVRARLDDQVVRREPVAVLGETAGVVADD